MMTNPKMEFTEWDVEVAKRIACAVVSYQAGVSFESLWEQYADRGEEVGTFWLSIARQIREDLPSKPK